MPIVAQNDFFSAVSIAIECTTFKWDLPNFCDLKEYYNNVSSSPFTITNTNSRCTLCLQIKTKDPAVGSQSKSSYTRQHYDYNAEDHSVAKQEVAIVTVNVGGKPLPDKVKIILSIINDRGLNLRSQSKMMDATESKIAFEMITTQELLSQQKYFHNDTLTFFCKIIHVKNQDSTVTGITRHVEYFDDNVQQKVEKFFDEHTFSDVMFNVQDTIMYGHRLILAANSSVFEAMFKTDMVEHTQRMVEITDTDPSIFAAFLKYIYTGGVDKLPEIGRDLIIVADKYLVQSLRDLCETSLTDNLSEENVLQFLVLAHLHDFMKLRSLSLAYVKTRQQAIIQTVEFKEICVTYPELINEIFYDSV